MDGLMKIRDVSVKYEISARTLRYYEDIGLISSTRNEDHPYRFYDEAAVKRLEQILILRKLNISIKDIRRIFSTAGTDAVLEVLGKKVEDIDDEVALLHELKEIVIAFIRQIEQADFSKDSDVKLLYDKAREIEAQLTNVEYAGNPGRKNEQFTKQTASPSPAQRLFEVTGKLEEKAASRLQIPDNVLKRMLQNVYFIWGNGGIEVADELGRRHGLFVYHTCNYRYKHFQNSDPRYQPGLCAFKEDNEDFWALPPEDAMENERAVVHDYTPMVIMDLIQLSAQHKGVICENDIDIENILQIVTHAVRITSPNDGFLDWYANEINRFGLSEGEKERYISGVLPAVARVKDDIPGEAALYGVKHIIADGNTTVEQTADEVAEYFGLIREGEA